MLKWELEFLEVALKNYAKKNLTILSCFALLSLVLLQISCKTEAPARSADYASGLYLEYMDSTINPGDNFQMYVNGKWIDETEIPSDKSSFAIGMILQELSPDHVKEIIEYAAGVENKDGTDEQKFGGLYASSLDMETRYSLGMYPLKGEFEKIESISNHKDLAKYLADANKAGYEEPKGMFVLADLKNPKSMRYIQGKEA